MARAVSIISAPELIRREKVFTKLVPQNGLPVVLGYFDLSEIIRFAEVVRLNKC